MCPVHCKVFVKAKISAADDTLQEEALSAEVRSSIVSHMVLVHQSVRTFSIKFLEQLRRHNYVTPKNYLDFIHNYKHALADNRTMFSGMAARLDGGLQKLIQVGLLDATAAAR